MLKLTEEEFYKQLQESKEGLEYLEIINSGKKGVHYLKDREPGFELHHIHPKSLGGSQSLKQNGVKLSVYDHCRAHALLAKAIPCVETLYMITALCRNQIKTLQDLDRMSLDEFYEWTELRRQAYKAKSESLKGHPVSEEVRRKVSENNKKLGLKPPARPKGSIGTTRGKIQVWRGLEKRYIRPEVLDEYLQKGFVRRAPESVRLKLKENLKKSRELKKLSKKSTIL